MPNFSTYSTPLNVEPPYRPDILVSDRVVFNQPRNIITLHPFTITNGGTNTNAITSKGGRPCVSITGGGASASDRGNFCYGVAGHILQQGKRARIGFSIYMIDASVQEYAFGLTNVVTAFIATPGTDYIGIQKLTAVAQPSLIARKASGTAQGTTIPLPGAISTAAVWCDFVLDITSDPTTAGQGLATVLYGENIAAGGALKAVATNIPIATQFPDTVAMGLFFAAGSGGTNADVNYVHHISLDIFG